MAQSNEIKDWATKYRPQTLAEVVGQETNVKLLRAMLDKNQLYDAMIFYGRSGCGKTTTARCLVNEMDADKIELDAASNSSVEDVRNLIEVAGRFSLKAKERIIIIDEAHALSKAAWQALLKSIEEPQGRTHWIFCTTEYKALPGTIKGRCHMFKYYSVPTETLVAYSKKILQKENAPQLSDLVLTQIVKESKNQVRDTVKLLQICSQNNIDDLDKLSNYLQTPKTDGMASFIKGVIEGDSKLAIRALHSIEINELEPWARALEEFIYAALEDAYGISTLNLPAVVAQKVREVTSRNDLKKFGKLLDKLLYIRNNSEAFQQLYILAATGV